MDKTDLVVDHVVTRTRVRWRTQLRLYLVQRLPPLTYRFIWPGYWESWKAIYGDDWRKP